MRRFAVCAASVAFVGLLVLVPLAASPAGASGTWSGSPSHSNCNVELEFDGAEQAGEVAAGTPGGGAAQAFHGWVEEYACELEVPYGWTMGAVDPSDSNFASCVSNGDPAGVPDCTTDEWSSWFSGGLTGDVAAGTCSSLGTWVWVLGVGGSHPNGYVCEPASSLVMGDSGYGVSQALPSAAGCSTGTCGLAWEQRNQAVSYGPDESGEQAVAIEGFFNFQSPCSFGSYSGCPASAPYMDQMFYSWAGDCSAGSQTPVAGANELIFDYATGWTSGEPYFVAASVDSYSCSTSMNVIPPLPSSVFSGGASTALSVPCGFVSAVGPASSYQAADTSYSFVVTFTGPVTEVVVDPGDTTGGPTVYGQSFGTDAVLSPEDPSSPLTLHFEYADPDTSALVSPTFWCYYGGVWYWGTSYSATSGVAPPSGDGTGGGLAGCFENAIGSVSLTDPLSWVEGAGEAGLCVAEWVFDPSSSSVDSLEQVFGISSSSPVVGASSASQWLGSMAVGVGGLPYTELSEVNTDASVGSCAVPDDPTWSIGSSSFTFCSLFSHLTPTTTGSSDGNAALTVLGDLLSAAVLTCAALGLIQLIRKILLKTG